MAPRICEQDRILVAADFQLASRTFYRTRIWTPAREVSTDLGSRAAWLEAITMLYEFDGRLYFSDGRAYRHPEIEDVFGDHGERWMGLFLEADASGQAPRRYSYKTERLRLIEVYCRLVKQQDWLAA